MIIYMIYIHNTQFYFKTFTIIFDSYILEEAQPFCEIYGCQATFQVSHPPTRANSKENEQLQYTLSFSAQDKFSVM